MKPNGRKNSRFQSGGPNPSEKTPPLNFRPDKEVLKDDFHGSTNGHGSFLRGLREEKGLSRRELARKSGLERTRILRAERSSWKEATLDELERISQGLGMRFEDLIFSLQGSEKGSFARSSLKEPFFTFDYAEGIRIASHVSRPRAYFVGTLTLAPHKTLAPDQAPRPEALFMEVLEGEVVLSFFSKPHVLKAGDQVRLEMPIPPYELYNSHQFKNAVLKLFTLPSFIQPSPL